NYTITLYKGTTPTGAACQLTGDGSATGCTIAYNTPVAAGDTFQLRVHRSSFTSVTASTDQTATETTTGSETNYVSLSTSCVSAAVATCDPATVASAGTVASAKLTFADDVPSGNSYTVTLMRNRNPTTSTCSVTGGGSSCAIPGGLVLGIGDTLELR